MKKQSRYTPETRKRIRTSIELLKKEGLSLDQITTKLQQQGFKSPSDGELTKAKINGMIQAMALKASRKPKKGRTKDKTLKGFRKPSMDILRGTINGLLSDAKMSDKAKIDAVKSVIGLDEAVLRQVANLGQQV